MHPPLLEWCRRHSVVVLGK